MQQSSIAIIGFGGHAHVVASALRALGRNIVAATDLTPKRFQDVSLPFPILTDEELVKRFVPEEIELALGIGSIQASNPASPNRKAVQEFQKRGYTFRGFCHPSAWVADDAKISNSAQIHAGAIVQSGARIDDFAILNTKSSVDHDCRIRAFCHIAPGATLSGAVKVGQGLHVGTGANIIQGISIGCESLVAAGATVICDVSDSQRVRGVPAMPFEPKS